MNPEDFNYFQSRVSRFISGSESRPLFGRVGSPKITRFSKFIPKRSVPSQVVSSSQDDIDVSKGTIPSLGRLTLNLEVINNNLDRIKEIIVNDYKETQNTNRKEIDDYRKRIANRGRVFGKRELGDKKSDILGTVRKYVGSFFSGTGGAIRALAGYNFLQALAAGDPLKAIQSLLGIGITYLPAIGGAIGATVATSLIGRLFGGAGRAAAGAAQGAGAAAGAGRLGGIARFGGRAALVGGGLALANSIFNRPEGDTQEQRLEDLTQQQKGLVDPQNLVPVPQDDLKRFENLNKRFEEALDFLLGKQKEQETQQPTTTGGGAPRLTPPGQLPNPYDIPDLNVQPGSIPSLEQFKEVLRGTPMESEAEQIYSTALSEGLNPAFVAGLAGAESSFGSAGIAVGTKNPFGLMTGYQPSSYADATRYLARRLRDPQGPYAGRTDFQQIMEKYSPPSENNLPRHMRNIISIGSRTGGDPRSLFLPLGSTGRNAAGMQLPPAAPILPPPTSRIALSPPSPSQPNVQILPMPIGGSSGAPTSDAVEGNDSTPAINTTHPENFLALYSKLMYQIV